MLTAAQCRAARAFVEWSRDQLSEASNVDADVIRKFETKFGEPDDAAKERLRSALETAGAVFLPEKGGAGEGVRLKFSRKGVKAVQRWEAEGGIPGDDDA